MFSLSMSYTLIILSMLSLSISLARGLSIDTFFFSSFRLSHYSASSGFFILGLLSSFCCSKACHFTFSCLFPLLTLCKHTDHTQSHHTPAAIFFSVLCNITSNKFVMIGNLKPQTHKPGLGCEA